MLTAYCDVCGKPDCENNADVRVYRKQRDAGSSLEWMLDICDECLPKFQANIPGTPRQDNTPTITLSPWGDDER